MTDFLPSNGRLLSALDTTWAPAEILQSAGWTVRRGLGGGNRVSAASGSGDVQTAVDALAAWEQVPLFQLQPDQADLDAELEGLGYAIHEPVFFFSASAESMIGAQSHMAAAYRCHCRPAIMEEIWAAGSIGPERLAIMDRVAVPKQLLMSRAGDRPAGVAFAAVDGDIAMVHAIEVLPQFRRKGCATLLLEAAARFAVEHGASWLTLAVTKANTGAHALYEQMGMVRCGAYHYRINKGGET